MTRSNRHVVVNADDFGVSEVVNDAIFDAHDRGVVSSTTLLVGGPAVQHALEGAAARPALGVGLHLDTSEFGPLSASFARVRESDPSLDLRRKIPVLPSLARAVADEWNAQIQRAAELGVELTHIDSHHFDHVNPMLIGSLAKVMRSAKLGKVRGMHNLWVDKPSRAVTAVKSAHRLALGRLGLGTTDFMCDVTTYLTLADQNRLPISGSIEVMAHPGHLNYAVETERLLVDGHDVFGDELVNWSEIVR